MPIVTIHEETPMERGWSFRVSWSSATSGQAGAGGFPCEQGEIELRLGWHDYEHWSHGVTPPRDVARAVMESVLDHTGVPKNSLIRGKPVDASTLRRLVAGLDDKVRERLA